MQSASNRLKIAGIVLLIAAGICLFVAIERYQSNADQVEAINAFGGGIVRGLAGESGLTPAVPTATKYALLFAVVCGFAGGYCIWKFVQSRSDERMDD